MGACGSQNTPVAYDTERTKPDPNASSSLDHDPQQLKQAAPLEMPIADTYHCSQCGMVFPSDEALYKHRTRFCLGTIDSNTAKRLHYSDDEDVNQLTPRYPKHQSPMDKKREEIHQWKNQRFVRQNVQDMEDRILRDSQKTQKLANDLKKRTHDYNQILKEYEELQAHERDLLRQMFALQEQSGSNSNQWNSLNDHQRNQLEILQQQNARLDQERRGIQNKLEELIADEHHPSSPSHYEPYKLLNEMKEEQIRNEKTLLNLRRRIAYPYSDHSTLPYISTYRKRSSDVVRPLRNGYLPLSFHDRSALTRSSDLEQRLRDYEYYPWLRDYPEPLRHYRYRSIETPNDKLKSLQNENQRLQNEVDNMERKFERLDSRTRQLELTVASSGRLDHRSNGYHSYPTSKIDQYPPITSSFNDTSTHPFHSNYEVVDQHRSNQQTSLPTLTKHTTSYVTQPTNYINSNMSKVRDPLGPQPYDPFAGFVIFFDFVVNLPANIDQCRLINCLHYPESGLGEPSQLQPFKCDLYTDETNGERFGVVLIATKQPVPRCSPQSTLSIVIEVQLTTKPPTNGVLRTNAWAKLPLFDHRNRLLSGRWKAPLKSLPIQHNENLRVINTLPSYGRAELHYRLVNSRDAPDQANATVSPTTRDLYFYPPQYRNGTYM